MRNTVSGNTGSSTRAEESHAVTAGRNGTLPRGEVAQGNPSQQGHCPFLVERGMVVARAAATGPNRAAAHPERYYVRGEEHRRWLSWRSQFRWLRNGRHAMN